MNPRVKVEVELLTGGECGSKAGGEVEMIDPEPSTKMDLALQVAKKMVDAGMNQDDLDTLAHAKNVLHSSRLADVDSSAGRRKIRALTRFVSKGWTAEECAQALGWDCDRVRDEAADWLHGTPTEMPLSECWLGPARHPWIARARQVAEARANKRDALRSRLLLRLKVAGEVLDEEEAAKLAGLNLAEWQLFCKTEDQAPPEEDGKYREGWIFEGGDK